IHSQHDERHGGGRRRSPSVSLSVYPPGRRACHLPPRPLRPRSPVVAVDRQRGGPQGWPCSSAFACGGPLLCFACLRLGPRRAGPGQCQAWQAKQQLHDPWRPSFQGPLGRRCMSAPPARVRLRSSVNGSSKHTHGHAVWALMQPLCVAAPAIVCRFPCHSPTLVPRGPLLWC
ncbi:unnamed protein product, partial [Amoebophrya sp. A120]